MFNWILRFCKTKKTEIRCSLWLHDNLSEDIALNFWSKYLKIARNQFGKTYFAKNKVGSRKIRKNIHQYGIIKIRLYNTCKLRLILGWIKGVLNS